MVAGNVAIAGIGDGAVFAAEAVPNGGAFAVLFGGPLDLEGTGGYPPDEVLGEGAVCARVAFQRSSGGVITVVTSTTTIRAA